MTNKPCPLITIAISVAVILGVLCNFAYSDDYWVYVQTKDNLQSDISENSQAKDIVAMLPVCPQFIPTAEEKKHWAIVKMSGLTKEDIQKYVKPMFEIKDGKKVIKAYREYKLDNLKNLGLDTIGLKQSVLLYQNIKANFTIKTPTDIAQWQKNKVWYDEVQYWLSWLPPMPEVRKAWATTTVISKINCDDEQYNSISIWEDATDDTSLITADEIREADCYDDQGGGILNDIVVMNINKTYVNSTHYRKITSPTGEHHLGTIASGFVLQATTTSELIFISGNEDYCQISNIVFDLNNQFAFGITIDYGSQELSSHVIENNIFYNTNNNSVNNAGIYTYQYGGKSDIIRNNLFYNLTGTNSKGIDISNNNGYTTGFYIYIVNNTFYNCKLGIHVNGGNGSRVYLTNNLVSCYQANNAFTDISCSASSATVTYCTTSDSTGDDYGGAGNRVNQTFTFINAASNYHLASNDAGARNFGTDTSGSPYFRTVDVDGETPPCETVIDMGYDEYCPVATPTPTLTITATLTATPTLTKTATKTATATLTQTVTPATPTLTITPTLTMTQTVTYLTPTLTLTATPTQTQTITYATPTMTVTVTETTTPTLSPTLTATPTITQTQTETPTITPTPNCEIAYFGENSVYGEGVGSWQDTRNQHNLYDMNEDDTNFDGQDLGIANLSTNLEGSVIRVDISSLTDYIDIQVANIWFYVTPQFTTPAFNVDLYSMINTPGTSWTETGSCWHTYNGIDNWTLSNGGMSDLDTILGQNSWGLGYGWRKISFNADGLIYLESKVASGLCNFYIKIDALETGAKNRHMYCSEYTTTILRPYLEIAWCPVITPTPTITITLSPTQTVTNTPTQTITQTLSPTLSATPSLTLTKTPSLTITQTPSLTITATPTITITQTPSMTPTVTPTLPCHRLTFGLGSEDNLGQAIDHPGNWEDTRDDSNNQTTNFDTQSLHLQNGGNMEYTICRTNISGVIPSVYPIISARVWFYTTTVNDINHDGFNAQIYGLTGNTVSWAEDQLNYQVYKVGAFWQNLDGGYSDKTISTYGETHWSTKINHWKFIEFNATGITYLQSNLNTGVCNFFIMIDETEEEANSSVMNDSENADVTTRPFIELYYCPVTTITPTQTITPATPTLTLSPTSTLTATPTITSTAFGGYIIPEKGSSDINPVLGNQK